MSGKKGNKNALKHGIFSKFTAVIDTDDQLEKMSTDKNTAELAYARARLAAAQKELDNAGAKYKTPAGIWIDPKIQWDAACRHWTEIIGRLINNNVNKGETETMVFESLMEAVRAANDKQKVNK